MAKAKHVQINDSEIKKIAAELSNKYKAEGTFWQNSEHVVHPLQFKSKKAEVDSQIEETAQYLLYITAINFSYWQTPINGKIPGVFTVNGYKTTWAMVASVHRAMINGNDILNPKYILSATDSELYDLFQPDAGHPGIPLLEIRVKNWREISKVLLEKYDGQIANLIKKCNNSAVDFINQLLDDFPCFRDEFETYGFYKRAQLLVADIWNHCKAQSYTNFHDIAKLSAFADYRVPQSLRALGAIQYGDSLGTKLSNFEEIPQYSDEELEIRAATIKACDEIAKSANLELGVDVINSTIVDNYLWVYVKFKVNESDLEPYHLTRCSNY